MQIGQQPTRTIKFAREQRPGRQYHATQEIKAPIKGRNSLELFVFYRAARRLLLVLLLLGCSVRSLWLITLVYRVQEDKNTVLVVGTKTRKR